MLALGFLKQLHPLYLVSLFQETLLDLKDQLRVSIYMQQINDWFKTNAAPDDLVPNRLTVCLKLRLTKFVNIYIYSIKYDHPGTSHIAGFDRK